MYENEKRKRYSITAKGRDVLGYYSGLQDLVQVSVD
jgi:predicted transcriptional regulator